MKVVAPAFSAIDRPEIPLRVSLTGIFLNLTFNYILIRVYNLGILGLTLTTASVATLNILQLDVAADLVRERHDVDVLARRFAEELWTGGR